MKSIFSDAALVSRAVVTYNEACSLALDMFQPICVCMVVGVTYIMDPYSRVDPTSGLKEWINAKKMPHLEHKNLTTILLQPQQ